MSVLVIAGVFALAVVGTAGAFGYRAIFGSSSSASVPPPVIKADSTPSKIVPAATKDMQSSKQITDRINEKGLGERLVSREEQPVAVYAAARSRAAGGAALAATIRAARAIRQRCRWRRRAEEGSHYCHPSGSRHY